MKLNAEQVLKLVEAGFDRDQILGMESDSEPERAAEEAEEKTEPVEEHTTATEPDRYGELLEAVRKLTGTIQASNILKDENKAADTLSVSDAIAQIVSPPTH